MSARADLLVAGVAGIVIGVVAGVITSSALAVLIGWDGAAIVYLARTWPGLWRSDAERTARLAVKADPTRASSDLILLGAAVASLAAVGGVLVGAASSSGAAQDARIALALVSIVASWGVVHTVYALRYAALYYTRKDPAVDFHQREPPAYADFLYVALTIGMTFQVSDTDLHSAAVRRMAIAHALLSYVFGTGVVATTVNLVASLTTK